MNSTTGIPPLGVRGPKHLNRRICRLEAEVANIKTLPYYRIFNREDERAADLAEAQEKLHRLKKLSVAGCQLPAATPGLPITVEVKLLPY